ncbi:MAG TPA: hypothetical protein VF126_16505 [Acidobacteriaceae bacterium]
MEIVPNPVTQGPPPDVNAVAEPLASSASSEREAGLEPAETGCTDIVPSPYRRELSAFETDLIEAEMPALPDHLRQIPFRLELRVPISRFTLRDLQQLTAGALLLTEHLSVRDLVLTAAGERLLLVELEAVEQQLAARVKRLAWRHKWRRKA